MGTRLPRLLCLAVVSFLGVSTSLAQQAAPFADFIPMRALSVRQSDLRKLGRVDPFDGFDKLTAGILRACSARQEENRIPQPPHPSWLSPSERK